MHDTKGFPKCCNRRKRLLRFRLLHDVATKRHIGGLQSVTSILLTSTTTSSPVSAPFITCTAPLPTLHMLHPAHMKMIAFFSISIYFVLNLVVTITNQSIVLRTQSSYFLTALHAAASYLSTFMIARFQNVQLNSDRSHTHRLKLFIFACLFTVNIALSNRALGFVSLSIHQTIRATAPALTIILTTILELRTWSSYSMSTYLSLVPIVAGVLLATYTSFSSASLYGIAITFLGTVTAVVKTMATHTFQTEYGIKGLELIHITTPIAVFQASLLAYLYGDFGRIAKLYDQSTASEERAAAGAWLLLFILFNVIMAAFLNLSSFEANRRCGPVSMGVAANLKQVVILLLPCLAQGGRVNTRVLGGGMMAISGGDMVCVYPEQGAAERV